MSVEILKWPAVIKFDDDDVLEQASSQDELQTQLQENHFINHALVIDIHGNSFNASLNNLNEVQLEPVTAISIDAFNQMVRNHLSACNQCCVLKITIESFSQGFALIKNTPDN